MIMPHLTLRATTILFAVTLALTLISRDMRRARLIGTLLRARITILKLISFNLILYKLRFRKVFVAPFALNSYALCTPLGLRPVTPSWLEFFPRVDPRLSWPAEARACDINYFIELKMSGFTGTPFNFFHYFVMDEARYLKYYFYPFYPCRPDSWGKR